MKETVNKLVKIIDNHVALDLYFQMYDNWESSFLMDDPPFCEECRGHCERCIISPEICGNWGTTGILGKLRDKYLSSRVQDVPICNITKEDIDLVLEAIKRETTNLGASIPGHEMDQT